MLGKELTKQGEVADSYYRNREYEQAEQAYHALLKKIHTSGLIDNCVFQDTGDGNDWDVQGVSVFSKGDDAWEEKISLGSPNAVYVETCKFNFAVGQDCALDAYNGAKYVFRYNEVNFNLLISKSPFFLQEDFIF